MSDEDEMLLQQSKGMSDEANATSNGDQQLGGGGVDSDTEDALKEFAFLSNEISSSSSSSSEADITGSTSTSSASSTDWNVDRAQIARLTELYKKGFLTLYFSCSYSSMCIKMYLNSSRSQIV